MLESGADINTRSFVRVVVYRSFKVSYEGRGSDGQRKLRWDTTERDVPSRAQHGWTALHLACSQGDLDTIRVLLVQGANPMSRLPVSLGRVTAGD